MYSHRKGELSIMSQGFKEGTWTIEIKTEICIPCFLFMGNMGFLGLWNWESQTIKNGHNIEVRKELRLEIKFGKNFCPAVRS